MDKKQLRNTLMLMACAFIWGTAFVAQSVGSDYMGPYTFLASRSWLACAFLLGLMAVLRKMGKTNPAAEPGFWQNKKVLLRGGIFCGVALFAASAAQQMGIGTTSTAKAGFMTALYVVLVPVAGVFLGSRPGVKLWCCVAASVVGLYLLCLAGRDTLSLTGGEWQILVCAILFTAQIMLVNHFSPQLDGIQLSFVQFFVVSVLSTIFAFVFEAPSPDQFRAAAVSIAYCGIMSSGVAYTLQIVGQKALDPTIASLAMCLESVFSALAGWLILGETLSATELCGCALMFGAIVATGQTPAGRSQTGRCRDGGLTISGGEPLLQLDFVSEVFRLARAKKVQTALDTSAQPFAPDNADWMARFDRLLENTDLVILDLKEIDDEKHKKLTGHSNKNILAMAQYVAARGVDLWVRHVLVPGLTDDADGLRQLDAFIKTLPTVRRVEILPYHTLGLFKWQNLGIPYPLDGVRVPTAEEVETAEQLLHVRDYPDAPKGGTTK